jgi:hypothetical protein
MPAMEVQVEIKGRIKDVDKMKRNILKAANDGLLELGLEEAVPKVKDQLYPGHGFVTGQLHRSIDASPQGDLVVQIDAGKSRYGANLKYANRIENRYKMFGNMASSITVAMYERFVGKKIMEAVK